MPYICIILDYLSVALGLKTGIIILMLLLS